MEECNAFLKKTWPALEDMDLPSRQQALEAAQDWIDVLDDQEPETDDEADEAFAAWANLRENMEDLVEDIMDLLEEQE